MKIHKHVDFDGPVCTHAFICLQTINLTTKLTIHNEGETLLHDNRVDMNRNNRPSTKPYLGGQINITIVHLVAVHACMQ